MKASAEGANTAPRVARGFSPGIARSERGAARLAHQSGGLGVESSNLSAPTITKPVQSRDRSDGLFRSQGQHTRTFEYDLEIRLTSVVGGGIAGLGLHYDPLGRLSWVASGSPVAVTSFLYDGDALVAEYDGSGMLLRRYVHGAGVDEPVVWYEGAGTGDRRWLSGDHQGSVIATSSATGQQTGTYAYGPYGEPANDNWTGARFRYTGQIALPEARLYNYKARVYDPSLGRFLQTDPIGYEDDLNLYAYVGNDPLNATDPTGEMCEDPDDENILCQLVRGMASAGRANFEAGSARRGSMEDAGGFATSGAMQMFGGTWQQAGAGALASGATAADTVTEGGLGAALRGDGVGVIAAAALIALPGPQLSPQKQAGHIPGTPQYLNRLRRTPTSAFFERESGEWLTQQAWARGTIVPGRPNVREYDFGVAVGTGPNGGSQTRVRVHMDQ